MENYLQDIVCDFLIYAAGNRPDGVLQDTDRQGYATSKTLEEMDAVQLLEIIDRASSLLKSKMASVVPEKGEPEKIHITKDYRILLPERGNSELRMAALPKSVFILFLKHPEGIAICDMNLYSTELYQIYCRITNRLDADAIRNSIQRISDRKSNCFNVCKTQLSRILSQYFRDSNLESYLISGPCDGPRYIPLRRSLVTWD